MRRCPFVLVIQGVEGRYIRSQPRVEAPSAELGGEIMDRVFIIDTTLGKDYVLKGRSFRWVAMHFTPTPRTLPLTFKSIR